MPGEKNPLRPSGAGHKKAQRATLCEVLAVENLSSLCEFLCTYCAYVVQNKKVPTIGMIETFSSIIKKRGIE
jgi:2-iminoacetate synthase ThiH